MWRSFRFKKFRQKKIDNYLIYKNNSFVKAPSYIPNGILNQFTVRAFNEAWFRKTPNFLEQEPQTIGQYFYPLDGVDNWNNIYGSKGFIQYQFVIPDQSSGSLKKILDILRKILSLVFLLSSKDLEIQIQLLYLFLKKGGPYLWIFLYCI